MMISNNYTATSARLTAIKTPTYVGGSQLVQPTTKTPPSSKMQEYMNKSKEAPSSLTGKTMIADLGSRAEALGTGKLNSNSKGLMAFFKQTSVYQFFFGKGEGKDAGNTTRGLEAVNDGVGHFSEIAIKGKDDTLKLGTKGELDLEKQKAALHGRELSDKEVTKITGKAPEPEDNSVTTADKVNSGFGIATSGIALVKSFSDAKKSFDTFGECSELSSKAKEKENDAIDMQQLRSTIGLIASKGTDSLAIQELMTGGINLRTVRPPHGPKILALAQQVTAALPGTDEAKLVAAITDKVKGKPLSQDQKDLLGTVSNALNKKSMALMDECNSLKKQASLGRREAGMELAKSVATMTEKSSNIASKIIDVTSKAGTHLATAAVVTGIASTVVATAEMAGHIHAAVKASGIESAMKAVRNPTEKSLTEASKALMDKAKKLEAKTDLKGAEKATIRAQIEKLRETSTLLSQTAEKLHKGEIKPEDLKLKSSKLDAAAKQIEKRQGFWSKVGNAVISALKVAAGIAATVAVFAGAVCLAATPVGWALGAAAIVGGIAMGCYKAHQAYSRWKQNDQLTEMQDKVSAKVNELKDPATYTARKTAADKKYDELGDQITSKKGQLTTETDPAKKEALKSEIKTLEGQQDEARTELHINMELSKPDAFKNLPDAETLRNMMVSADPVERGVHEAKLKLAEAKELKKDISIMQCRKDPAFAAKQMMHTLTLDTTSTGLTQEKIDNRNAKRLEAESVVEALGLNPDTLRSLPLPEAEKKLYEFLNPS